MWLFCSSLQVFCQWRPFKWYILLILISPLWMNSIWVFGLRYLRKIAVAEPFQLTRCPGGSAESCPHLLPTLFGNTGCLNSSQLKEFSVWCVGPLHTPEENRTQMASIYLRPVAHWPGTVQITINLYNSFVSRTAFLISDEETRAQRQMPEASESGWASASEAHSLAIIPTNPSMEVSF